MASIRLQRTKPRSNDNSNLPEFVRGNYSLRTKRLAGKPRLASSHVPLWAKLSLGSTIAYILFFGYFMDSFQSHLKEDTAKRIPKDQPATGDQSATKYQSATSQDGDTPKNEQHNQNQPPTIPLSIFEFDSSQAELVLKTLGPKAIRKTISAYLEPPMHDTVPGTGSQGNLEQEEDRGIPPDFVVPLPLRTTNPRDLKKYEYQKFQTCNDMPGKLPIDRGLEYDVHGKPIVWNVGNTPTQENFPWTEAPFCPVDADPFLPWIHDIFPSIDGSKIEFVAQNKRRCNTGKLFRKDLKRLEPQVALLQPISVARINENKARELAPLLWQSDELDDMPRYRLAPFDEAAPDGKETRFICRFHSTDFSSGTPKSIILGETLSEYPFNYELVSYRKMKPTMITPKGKDNNFFWTSNLRFECPVPSIPGLQHHIATSSTVLSDGTPTIHLDLIPIRTSPRFGIPEIYFSEDMAGPREGWGIGNEKLWRNDSTVPVEGFNASLRWGNCHVLPRVEASGRWTNLPICRPPSIAVDKTKNVAVLAKENKETRKPHLLSACLWASASFKTRGKDRDPVMDTAERLVEWIEFHLLVGFDHIYVYDNSGAQSNESSLISALERFPNSQVTRIDWPSIICNNNIPAHDNTGERSSQYAAENSCRTRYAPFTEWIVAFDTDEYLVPMGEHRSLREVVINAGKKKVNILSFRSTRSKLLFSESEAVGGYRRKKDSSSFLEAYNCDGSSNPKPLWADRARKQVYRSDYVLYHFVHYSTVTQGMNETFKSQKGWKRNYHERSSSERTTDETNEAVMLHAKTITEEQTVNWMQRCHHKFEKKWRGCSIGFAWPKGVEEKGDMSHNADGLAYNCFTNEKITKFWIPKLQKALAARNSSNVVI